MKKKGIGHLEVILSFVIFLAAVGFALYLFSPGGDRMVNSYLNYIFDDIENNASSYVYIYSVKINGSFIGEAIAVDFARNFGDANISVINSTSQALISKMQNGVIGIACLGNNGSLLPNNSLVKVIVGEGFSSYPSELIPANWNSLSVNKANYEIASTNKKKILTEQKLLAINFSYYSDYGALKQSFNTAGGADFSFIVTFSNNDRIEAKRQPPVGIDVFSDKRNFEILRENGQIDFADVGIQIW